MASVRQYAFEDTINYSISNTSDIVELPNRLLYTWTIYPQLIYAIENSRNKTTFDMYFNCSAIKLCTSWLSDMMRDILVTEQFRPACLYK